MSSSPVSIESAGSKNERMSRIIGIGHYVPARRVTSAELERRLSLEPGWILSRTGVDERRFASDDQAVSDLAANAAKQALREAGVPGRDIGLLLLATSTPDHPLPPTAPLLADKIGCHGAAMDLAGACTGFVYALALADGFLRSHGGLALVVGANVLSRRINLDDRASSILFGDGAGAVVMSSGTKGERTAANGRGNTTVADNADEMAHDTPHDTALGTAARKHGLLGMKLSSQGALYDLIKLPAGGSREPLGSDTRAEDCAIQLSDGGAAFAAAIHSMAETSQGALADAGLKVADIDWWIPHQANRRIIEAAGRKIDMPMAKMLFTIAQWGNSSAATIPLTLSHHWRKGVVKPGDTVLLSAVGAGFTEGSVVYRL